MVKPTILVTGGTGFVGRELCRRLAEGGYHVRVPIRFAGNAVHKNCMEIVTGDLTQFANWRELVRGVNIAVHLMARTHCTNEFGDTAIEAYRATNVDVTRRLAAAAKQEGVRQLIYLSSIKAVSNSSDTPLVESSPCHPVDSYGVTKLEAEQTVRRQLLGSGTAYTLLRPPLVYGPNVRGNFLRLLALIQRGVPLPGIRNLRSLIHLDNLVDVICACLENTNAFDQTFHVADRNPISTADLIRGIAKGLGTNARVLPVPRTLLSQLGKAVGKGAEVQRFVDSLIISSETVQQRLGWQPRIETLAGVEQTAHAFARADWSDRRSPQPIEQEAARAA